MAKQFKNINPDFIDNKTIDIVDNSAKEVSMNGDVLLDNFNISLEDHDKAVLNHIKNNLKPYVIENGVRIDVPVFIGNRELWESMQLNGYYRDKTGKILAPLIALNRTNISRNREYMSKIDAHFPQKNFVVEKKYSKENYYDRFSVLNNQKPVKELYTVQVPDYLDISYDVVMLTNYFFQMNTLNEIFLYADNSYWGDDKYRFKAKIDSISNFSEYSVGEERYNRNNFSIDLKGYIIPNVMQKELNKEGKFYSKTKFTFKEEVVTSL